MTMEHLISLQNSGSRDIGEPAAARPAGVHQGAVLVVLDVNKEVHPGALYWALANVVRKGDMVKILGIITHIPNSLGFMMRVEQSIRNSPNIMELQFEIATKKEAIWRTNHINEWSLRAGVTMDVDVKAGNHPKLIATDEAKSIGAYHVVLDKTMKKDRKYFIDNLTCFVSRFRSGGGVDTIRSYAVSSKLPPMTPKHSSSPSQQSSKDAVRDSDVSRSSSGGGSGRLGASSMSSTSFELIGGESSDEFSAQSEGDPLSAPSTGESMERPSQGKENELVLKLRTTAAAAVAAPPPTLFQLLRGHVVENGPDQFYNCVKVNPLRNPVAVSRPDFDQGPLTPRQGQRISPQQMNSFSLWKGQINVVPEMGRGKMGSQALATTLLTQATFNCFRQPLQQRKADKLTMDMQWPLMHWADCQVSMTNGVLLPSSASQNSLQSFLSAARKPRQVSAASVLNYDNMIDSD